MATRSCRCASPEPRQASWPASSAATSTFCAKHTASQHAASKQDEPCRGRGALRVRCSSGSQKPHNTSPTAVSEVAKGASLGATRLSRSLHPLCMQEEARPLPTCDESCCAADVPGSWCDVGMSQAECLVRTCSSLSDAAVPPRPDAVGMSAYICMTDLGQPVHSNYVQALSHMRSNATLTEFHSYTPATQCWLVLSYSTVYNQRAHQG